MNNIAVVYKSSYGTTKKYAEWVAEAFDGTLFEASAVKSSQLKSFDLVIHGGGLYAGSIDGGEAVAGDACKSLVIFTVGLANPETTDYSDILNKNFTKEMLAKIKFFHLRGGIDYEKLSFVHKGMMAALKMTLILKDKSKLSDEDREFLATYGQKVDFMDKSSIEPIVEFVKKKMESKIPFSV